LPLFWDHAPWLTAARSGYVVVAPDYPGLGGAGVHPYLVGPPTARSILDAVRAAGQVKEAAAGKRFAVWGESQGGHAALWTAQVQPTYAPELTLVGAAAAAPPTDLRANLRQAPNAMTRAFFTAYIGASWSAHYGAPLSSFAGPSSRSIIGKLAKKCVVLDKKPNLGAILGMLTLRNNLKNTDLTTLQPWSQLAATNSPQVARYSAPLLIAQNPKDDLVAPAVTRSYAQALCGARQPVRWIDIQGSGHATSAKDSAAATLGWIADRFAGRAAPDDCGRF
jgi:pimeloyl-ACP methyl ester carboxylesterase